MNWSNDLIKIFKTKYPIIQAPMFGVTTPEMVAAAGKANCLGSLALGDLNADKCAETIRSTKSMTDKPFAVNIFVNKIPEITDDLKERFTKTKVSIEKFAHENQLEVNLPDLSEINFNTYHEQIDAIISENCKILSFTFGNLDEKSIQTLKNNGIVLIGTCTSVREALVLEKSGIDIICVQGIEAGGHRGSFTEENIPEIGGLSLLSQVYDAVKIPIIYAGGIYNSRTLMAAEKLGAQGFQIGSLLLGSAESGLKEFEKECLRNLKENEIILTKSFSGRFARGLKNKFIERFENSELILPYPYQNKLTGELRKAAKTNENADFVSIWAGQSIHQYSAKSTSEILMDLINEVNP